jgi:hypothetical protein
MLLAGAWKLCDDGVVRPVFRGEMQAAGGEWVQVLFLADCGADRTVLSANDLQRLGLRPIQHDVPLAGVGGHAASVIVETQIYLARAEGGSRVVFRGQFAALTDPAAMDMSVVGRDITNLFALIIDRQQDQVCLLGKGHRYSISTE